jgi:hypothetical protein
MESDNGILCRTGCVVEANNNLRGGPGRVGRARGRGRFRSLNRYGVEAGQREYGEYQKNLALGADIATLATMSPDEQMQTLARQTPVAGSEGFAEQDKRQGVVVQNMKRIAKERDDDPAASALRRLPAGAIRLR